MRQCHNHTDRIKQKHALILSSSSLRRSERFRTREPIKFKEKFRIQVVENYLRSLSLIIKLELTSINYRRKRAGVTHDNMSIIVIQQAVCIMMAES